MGKRKSKPKQLELPMIDHVFAQALRDAEDIRQWTDGPRVAPWRIYRLAQALTR